MEISLTSLAAFVWAITCFGAVVLLRAPRLPRWLNKFEVALLFLLVTYYLAGLAARGD